MAFEDTLMDFDTLDFTLEDLERASDPNPLFSSSLYDDYSTLCIPDDPIEDIFASSAYTPTTVVAAATTTPSTPEQKTETHTKKRGFDDENGILSWRKKQRSKRNGGRTWSTRVVLPVVLPVRTRCCGHCGTDKTPQWRQGPMGPKTLCNACGVRYKSGRLVPEYRPIASPTFDSRRHSNSHRKIVRMRMANEE